MISSIRSIDEIAERIVAYTDGVASGDIPAGRLTRLAIERHLSDLEHAGDRGFRFDLEAAAHAINFIELLSQSKGEWAGQPLKLRDDQIFVVASIFGWVRIEDGTRRFKTVYKEIPRKNGKTTLAAAIGAYMGFADGEDGAEIYFSATKRDQAKIGFDECERMVRKAQDLFVLSKIANSTIAIFSTGSKIQPLSADHNTLDGLNPSCNIIDELHKHKDRQLWDVLDTALGARRQPLQVAITTAGTDKHTICYELHQYTDMVLRGEIEDDSFFGIIYHTDQDDDPVEESTWIKANPGFGQCLKPDSMQEQARKAKASRAAMQAFKRYRLNEWVESEFAFLVPAEWDDCIGEDGRLELHEVEESLSGRQLWCGVDLGSTDDITAFVAIAEQPGSTQDAPKLDVFAKMWVPEDLVSQRSKEHGVPYRQWIEDGWLSTTPGDIVDLERIQEWIYEFAQRNLPVSIAYDPYQATQMATTLYGRGVPMVEYRQLTRYMSEPTKHLEVLVKGGSISHYGNPVMSWMARNLTVQEDFEGNIRPVKMKKVNGRKRRAKIDAMTGLIMAIGRYQSADKPEISPYEERGVRYV